MIKRSADFEREVRHEMRGGAGDALMTNFLGASEMPAHCRVLSRIQLEPGCSIGVHDHVDETEIYIIECGTGTVNDDGTPVAVGPGDVVVTGGGASHSIVNDGTETLSLIAVIVTVQ